MKSRILWVVPVVCLSGLFGCNVGPGPRGEDGAQGLDGKDGRDGVDGRDGGEGQDGAPGHDTVLSLSEEAAGEHCPHGGQKLQSGVDLDRSGTLDASEVSTTQYLCNGAPGEEGAPSRLRTSRELAGAACAFGGVRLEAGSDANRNGALDDDEVDPTATQFLCDRAPAWSELAPLPEVSTLYSFAMTTDPADGSLHLGAMFFDAAYQAQLVEQGALWDGGGSYSGKNTYVTYQLDRESRRWVPYEGRKTPQFYLYSELVIIDGHTFYTTNYNLFGGLLSAIIDGEDGFYALTPAFADRRAHSVTMLPGSVDLLALVAQKNVGLTVMRYSDVFTGGLGNHWTNLVTLAADATTVTSPQLLLANTSLVASYVLGGRASVRLDTDPASITSPADLPEVGACETASESRVAFDGTFLYLACVDTAKTLTVKRASLATLPTVSWESVATGVQGAVDAFDLEASQGAAAIAVRQGSAVRVYAPLAGMLPAFDAMLPGRFDLTLTSSGPVLTVGETSIRSAVRTFVP